MDNKQLTSIDLKDCKERAMKWAEVFAKNNPYNQAVSPEACESPF